MPSHYGRFSPGGNEDFTTGFTGFSQGQTDTSFDFGGMGAAVAGGPPGVGAFAVSKGLNLAGKLVESIFGAGEKKKARKAFEAEGSNLSALGEEDFLDPFAIARFARKESRSELKDAASKLADLSGGQLSDFDLFGALRENQADTLGSELFAAEKENQFATSQRKTNIGMAKFNAALTRYMNA